MINMQEQMKTGFNHISREIRSLSSSVQPQITLGEEDSFEDIGQDRYDRRIKEKAIEEHDDDYKYETDEDSIVEINPRHDDSYSDEEEELSVDEEAQKQFVKEHRKQIRV
jgi:hypothetical protein